MYEDIPPKMLEWGSTLDQTIIDLSHSIRNMEEVIEKIISIAKTPEEGLLAIKFIYGVWLDKLFLPIDAIDSKTQEKILSQINLKINGALLRLKLVDSANKLEEEHD